jgi:hypothetical protein
MRTGRTARARQIAPPRLETFTPSRFVTALAVALGIFLSIALATGWWIFPETGANGYALTPPCPAPAVQKGGWRALRAEKAGVELSAPAGFQAVVRTVPDADAESRDEQWRNERTDADIRTWIDRRDPGPPHLFYNVTDGPAALLRCRDGIEGQDAWIASTYNIAFGPKFGASATLRRPDGRYVTVVGWTRDMAGQAALLAAFRTIRLLPLPRAGPAASRQPFRPRP